jgi:hypothetical protein
MWLEQHPDFEDVLQHANKLAAKDPELARAIVEMPDGFARQKLVYNNIKAMGLDKPPQKQENIQDKIDSTKRGAFYQPSGIGTAPYASAPGDFSPQGQKNAYDYIQSLKGRLGLGG